MTKGRQVQHRAEREVIKGQELTAARKEVRQLKRLVSRLQKTIRKLEDQRGAPVEIESEEVVVIEPTALTVGQDQNKCSKCGSEDLTRFTTPGGKTLVACRTCKARF
jgi:hypothetical protein